jgi:hypothetical protein
VQQTKVSRIARRFTDPQALNALLHDNGFDVVEQYGDWDRSPLQAESPSIISLCKAQGKWLMGVPRSADR